MYNTHYDISLLIIHQSRKAIKVTKTPPTKYGSELKVTNISLSWDSF